MKKTAKNLTLRHETIRQLSGIQLSSAHGGKPIEQTARTVCADCSPSNTLPCTNDSCPGETVQATTCTITASA